MRTCYSRAFHSLLISPARCSRSKATNSEPALRRKTPLPSGEPDDDPTCVQGFERQRFQNEHVRSALNEITQLSAMDSFPLRSKRKDTPLLLIVKRRTEELANGCLLPQDLTQFGKRPKGSSDVSIQSRIKREDWVK